MAAAALTISTVAPIAAEPAFEVASVKTSQPCSTPLSRRQLIDPQPGSLTIHNARFASCVSWAFNLAEYQISGQSWINSERFDIVAKTSGPVKESELRLMLQALLVERFHLSTHRETKELSVYSLVVGKNGHKLRRSGEDGPIEMAGPGATVLRRVPIAQLAEMLSGPMQAPVLDRTGLTGFYDFTFDMSRYFEIKPGADRPQQLALADIAAAFVTGVQEQLGLKLESGKAPVEMLIIDRADKSPEGN